MARLTRSATAKIATPKPSKVPLPTAVQLSSPPATPEPAKGRKRKAAKAELDEPSANSPTKLLVTPKSSWKRTRAGKPTHGDINELPHNLGTIPSLPTKDTTVPNTTPKNTQKPRKSIKNETQKSESVEELVAKATEVTNEPVRKTKKEKNNTYGLTPGQTPFPKWAHPTPEECHEVARLLSTVHGEVKPPKTIAPPSLTVSGCGEVPSVLDALIRTRLSAATTGTNSSRAFAGLVAKFGILEHGIGKGSVDWNKVRLADIKDVFEAIKSGGLADVKSKDIKKILQMVWEENQSRRAELLADANTHGSSDEPPSQVNMEITKAEQDVLSLDHLHHMSNDEAFKAMTKYPGIGPKTASCVLLFCLQRPSFAVDTHVFRLSKWLGWVPPAGDPAGLPEGAKGKFSGANRNSAYAHLEVMIPDGLKYPLHQLFIYHGKSCPRCRAITGETSEGWEEGCVIDHLVQRTGGRKDARPSPTKAKPAKAPKVKMSKSRPAKDGNEDEDESSGLSDLEIEDNDKKSSTSEVKGEDNKLGGPGIKGEGKKSSELGIEDEDSDLSDPETDDEGSVYGSD